MPRRVLVSAVPLLAAAALALLLYAPILHDGFVRDDHDLVERNPLLVRSEWLGRLLTHDFWASAGVRSGMWRPAVTATYIADARAGGGPRPFHLTNLLLHGAVSALVAALAAAGGGWMAALAAGAWYATMPAHVESVAWICGRTDVLCAGFAALALLLDRRARRGGGAWFAGALGAFALALLAKETALLWPVVIAIDRRVDDAPGRERHGHLLGYVTVAVAYLGAHALVTHAVPASPWLDAHALWLRHVQSVTVLPLLASALLPGMPHAADRLPPVVLPGTPMFAAGVAALVCAIGAAAWAAVRRSRWATPLAAFVAPVAAIATLAATTGYVTVAERNDYLPSIGAALALGMGVALAARAAARPPVRVAAAVAAGLLVVTGIVETHRQLRDWRDDATLYASMVRIEPAQPAGHLGLANVLAGEGRDSQATAELSIAALLEPANPEIAVTRARIAADRRDWSGELAEARTALIAQPDREDALVHAVSALLHLDRAAAADSLLVARGDAVRQSPVLASLRGRALLRLGRPAEALPLLEIAVTRIVDDAGVWAALGEARFLLERPAEAADAFARALRLEPGAYDGWLRLAVASTAAGDARTARAALRRAAALPEARDGQVERLAEQLAPHWSR